MPHIRIATPSALKIPIRRGIITPKIRKKISRIKAMITNAKPLKTVWWIGINVSIQPMRLGANFWYANAQAKNANMVVNTWYVVMVLGLFINCKIRFARLLPSSACLFMLCTFTFKMELSHRTKNAFKNVNSKRIKIVKKILLSGSGPIVFPFQKEFVILLISQYYTIFS